MDNQAKQQTFQIDDSGRIVSTTDERITEFFNMLVTEKVREYQESAQVAQDKITALEANINNLAREQAQKMLDNGTYTTKITALEKAVKNVNEDNQRLEANADRTEAFLHETITDLEAEVKELKKYKDWLPDSKLMQELKTQAEDKSLATKTIYIGALERNMIELEARNRELIGYVKMMGKQLERLGATIKLDGVPIADALSTKPTDALYEHDNQDKTED